MCLNPKWIYKKGKYVQDNYRGQEGEPYELGTYSKCGSCSVCINEKMNNWVIRNFYEAKKNEDISFITLTYRDSSYILVKKDLQDFIKRLRTNLQRSGYDKKIRYFACGEYGTKKGRCHFHLLIYGWKDPNAKYLDINKKGSILMKSDLIEKTWGLGRTSYQTFNHYEIPYLAIYETPQETFKKAYKLSRERVKKLREMALKHIRNESQRKNLMEELIAAEKEMEAEKKEYTMVKEFNTWSIALGWEEFYKEYAKQRIYTWEEYIEDKVFVTPSTWVKKLANMGDIAAANEMFKREREIEQSATEKEEALKNRLKVEKRRKKEIEEWVDKKDKLADF